MIGAPCARHVLVVEDDREVRDSISEILEDNAYVVSGAKNGLDALVELRAAAEKPCVILLDLMMPLMNGAQFMTAQQQDPTLAAIPVVILTAHPAGQDAAREMGANGFIAKPVRIKALLAAIQLFCAEAPDESQS